MEIMAAVTEIDGHIAVQNNRLTPRVIVVTHFQCARRIGYFPHTAEMVPGVVIIAGIAAANALFALGKEAFCHGCPSAVAFLANLGAAPDERLSAGGLGDLHPSPHPVIAKRRLVAAYRVDCDQPIGSIPFESSLSAVIGHVPVEIV